MRRYLLWNVLVASLLLLVGPLSQAKLLARFGTWRLIALQASDDHYLEAQAYTSSGTTVWANEVTATADDPQYIFYIVSVDHEYVTDGDEVQIRSKQCDSNGCHAYGPWITDDSTYHILSLDQALGYPVSEITYHINAVDSCECEIGNGDEVLFRSYDGSRYWSADDGGGAAVHVNQTNWGSAEVFRFYYQ
jgi:hypothetical protein